MLFRSTSDVAFVRFIGRRNSGEDTWTYPYRYTREELAEWVPKLESLAASSSEVHVIMDNNWGSDAVDNALEIAGLTAHSQPGAAPCTTDP